MQNWASLQETKQHGAVRFPFNLYPCTIPGDFPQVALHWQESMELVFVKRGAGLVQVGAVSYLARMGDTPWNCSRILQMFCRKQKNPLRN